MAEEQNQVYRVKEHKELCQKQVSKVSYILFGVIYRENKQ